MTNDSIATALERVLRLLSQTAASSAESFAAAEEMRATIGKLDEAETAAQQRRTSVLTIPPTGRAPGRAAIVAALETLDAESRNRAVQREIVVSFLAQLEARASEAKKAEAIRDEARKPFKAETKRAREYAQRAAEAPKMFERVIQLFRTDVILANLGKGAYSNVPYPQGKHFAYERNIDVPRTIASEDLLRATKLPGFWPPRYSDFSVLEPANWFWGIEDDGSDANIVDPLRALLRKANDPEAPRLSNDEVDHVVVRAQALLVGEFKKIVDAIHELLALDGTVTAADRAARYPDGAPIFDLTQLPKDWAPGLMNKRVLLPAIGGMAQAAE